MPTDLTPRRLPGSRIRRFRRLARLGFAVNGLLHLVIGAIAIRLAFGDTSVVEADASGAIARLTSAPLGRFAIWAAFAAVLALGLWQLSLGGSSDSPRRATRWGRRVVEAGKGLASLALAGTALVFALGGSTSSSTTIRTINQELVATTTGLVILALTGAIVLGSGIGFIAIGVRRGFRKLIRVPSGRRGRVVSALGTSGYIAKGVAVGLAGAIFLVAAATGDADRATGLDGAFRFLALPPYGTAVLVVVGLGVVQYGVFLMARTTLARL
ncbi:MULTISPECIES: DUF1206 domain-containing protein [unclassified Rathayibacter]|uniref:DUF1206 domain-containing protein n=1 Tax=unclassified Rathayibacter TaxID=2609250 RepID=UPI0006F967ED|nr:MULTISPECIES: DUF1206 domain-containing protein [unclassified Rathayibacter]KQQ03597.1 hypothetical protein ASF42_08865 [Rathayibacter sp. Leaf294]KQS12053.1 hypothetical protein ASG06_08865 [Rathayibacter sp. Leaf185]